MKRIGGVVVRKLDKTGVTANNVISCIFLHLYRVYRKVMQLWCLIAGYRYND
jgi:hypothetical protein